MAEPLDLDALRRRRVALGVGAFLLVIGVAVLLWALKSSEAST